MPSYQLASFAYLATIDPAAVVLPLPKTATRESMKYRNTLKFLTLGCSALAILEPLLFNGVKALERKAAKPGDKAGLNPLWSGGIIC